jgi:ketosteroid isomerase-like protein
MRRREFAVGAGTLIGAACAPNVSAADDATAIKQAIADVYVTFYAGLDKQKYRALLTEDYVLLEQGKLLDIEGDLALMPTPESGYKRADAFDFRSVRVHGDIAYAVYFLKSEIKDAKGTRNREWLESAILRRSGSRWLMALLHSTRIMGSGA